MCANGVTEEGEEEDGAGEGEEVVETEAAAVEGSTAAIAEDAWPSPSASGRKSPVFDAIKMEWRGEEKERCRVVM